MASVYLEVQLSGDAPDASDTANIVRIALEEYAEEKRNYIGKPHWYCEDVKVIPNWRLEDDDD